MANKKFSIVYQTIDFYSNIRTYYLYALFFRQIKIVFITNTDCIIYVHVYLTIIVKTTNRKKGIKCPFKMYLFI